MGSLLVGLLSGLVTLASIKITMVEVESGVLIAAFVIAAISAIVQFSILSQVIASGTATTFVCLALDQKALQRSKPSLWVAFVGTYHSLGLGIFTGEEEA
jgi:hypothetical protein